MFRDVLEHCVCSIFIGGVNKKNNTIYEDGTDSVPKRRYIKFRRRGITQKKEYNIQNKAEV
jgi:hypothetical protein